MSDWARRAACRDETPALFYEHENGKTPLSEKAVSLCASCPVRLECLTYALHYEPFGYWAGTTAKERDEMRAGHHIALRQVRSLLTRSGQRERIVYLRTELRLVTRPTADDKVRRDSAR